MKTVRRYDSTAVRQCGKDKTIVLPFIRPIRSDISDCGRWRRQDFSSLPRSLSPNASIGEREPIGRVWIPACAGMTGVPSRASAAVYRLFTRWDPCAS